MDKLKYLEGQVIPKDLLKTVDINNCTSHIMIESQKRNDELVKQIQISKQRKEEVDRQKHNEVISAIKEAGKNGATINIGDNTHDFQIQQNTSNSNQIFNNTQTFDYEKAYGVLKDIKSFFDYPHFNSTFADNSDIVKQIVESTIEAIEKKDDSTLIKKSLHILKDLAIGASSSLIATGIIGLLTPIL